MKAGKALFAEWVDEVGGAAVAAQLLGRNTASGIYHLIQGKRAITPELAQQVHDLSRGRYDRADLVFGQPRVAAQRAAAVGR